jgi:hypothetical protein
MVIKNNGAHVNYMELYQQMLNRETDEGKYQNPVCWRVSQELAGFLDVELGNYLIWRPDTRQLTVLESLRKC